MTDSVVRMIFALLVTAAVLAGVPAPDLAAASAMPADPWTWPVTGPVIAAFDPPDDPYGSGHRGIDIAVAVATPVLAPADGVVTFAGPVGGRLFVTVDHGAGVRSTSSFLSALGVRRGQAVLRGQVLGRSGSGHAGAAVPHVHFSVRLDDVYVDPLAYLEPLDVSSFLRLAPVG